VANQGWQIRCNQQNQVRIFNIQLVDDDGDDEGGQLRTKSIPQGRVYHDDISNEEDEDYCAENSIPSGPSDNDSEEVAWSQRNSAYSAVAWSQ
jgi:hypothetical protein